MWQPDPNLACTDVQICNTCFHSLNLSTPKSCQLHICLQKPFFSTFYWPMLMFGTHYLEDVPFGLQASGLCMCPFSSKVGRFVSFEGFFCLFLFSLLVSWICLALCSGKSMWEMEKEGRRRFSFAEFISSFLQTLAKQVCTEEIKTPELSWQYHNHILTVFLSFFFSTRARTVALVVFTWIKNM